MLNKNVDLLKKSHRKFDSEFISENFKYVKCKIKRKFGYKKD